MPAVTETDLGIYVEPWPSGGWAVRVADHPGPVSRHDTEEEAYAKADAYRRGAARQRLMAPMPRVAEHG